MKDDKPDIGMTYTEEELSQMVDDGTYEEKLLYASMSSNLALHICKLVMGETAFICKTIEPPLHAINKTEILEHILRTHKRLYGIATGLLRDEDFIDTLVENTIKLRDYDLAKNVRYAEEKLKRRGR